MNDYINRQLDLLTQIISEYELGKIKFYQLVQRLDSITDMIDLESWRDEVYGIRITLEEINAITLDEDRPLNDSENSLIAKKLSELSLLIDKYQH